MENNTKICTGCKLEKPISDFGFHLKCKDNINPKCKKCVTAQANERYRRKKLGLPSISEEKIPKHPGKMDSYEYNRSSMLKAMYGITQYDFDKINKKQNGCCAICGNPEIPHVKKIGNKEITCLSVDHCHETNKVRGLLCTNCNIGLGNFRDSPKFLLNAIKYLIKSRIENQQSEEIILQEINKLMLISNLENPEINSIFNYNQNNTNNLIWKK